MGAATGTERIYLVINRDVILMRTTIPGEARAFQNGLQLPTAEVFVGRVIWPEIGGDETEEKRAG